MEFLGNVFSVVLSPLISLMDLITLHATYPFEVGSNVKALQEAAKDLVARMKDVNFKIETAEREGLASMNEVKRWLEKVEAIVSETHLIGEKYNHRGCKCLRGYSVNCCINYTIGKKAAKNLVDVQKLYDDGAFELVAMKSLPPLIQEKPTTSKASSKVDPNLQKALYYLKEDDNVTIIGIWGMGGIGKTHLLKQIKDSFHPGNPTFSVVILVTASRGCSATKIQDEIFEKLCWGKSNDVQLKAHNISKFLTNRSFLLLVDDLWGCLDLEQVGIPYLLTGVGLHKQKVVLTTRSDEVCSTMKVEGQIKLDKLDEACAWSLFQENVGKETLSSNSFIPVLGKEVVKKLGGLPLALITTARAMRTKKHYRAWEGAIELLKESRLCEIERHPYLEESTTFHILKFSYDCLESDTLRQCFLSCSMWPDDYEIPKEELIRCWIGLGLVDVSTTVRSAYNTGYTLIDILQAACLLESTRYDNEEVKMHDVLRDMALWIARDCGESNNKWIVKAKVGQVEEQDCYEAERISLMMNNLETLPFPCSIRPHHTNLTTLLLQGNRLHGTALRKIQIFDALTYLDLDDNSLNEFPVEICKLVKLQYLSLARNDFESLPEDLQSLTNLKYLHLRHNIIQTISKGAISELNALQVLDLYSSWPTEYLPSLLEESKSLNNLRALGINAKGADQFRSLVKSSNLPIKSLRLYNLTEVTLPLTDNFLGNTTVQKNLNSFVISMSNTQQIQIESSRQDSILRLEYLEGLFFTHMHHLNTILWKGVSPKNLCPKLRRLHFIMCPMLKDVSWIVHLPCLWELIMDACFNMKYLVCTAEKNHGKKSVGAIQEEETGTLISTFSCLEIIELYNLRNLHGICDPAFTFPSLRLLKLIGCPKLESLPFRLQTIPSKLESIDCQRSWWEGLEWEEDSLRSFLQIFCILH